MWFESQFTNKHTEPSLPPFDGPPRPLNTPITPTEVKCAAKSLKNGRATGPDGVQNELLKYGGDKFYSEYSGIINSCFETNTHLTTVGEAVITPLQKPGKAKGPLTSIRPLTLSNSFRKILSLITLRRIQQQVDNYTGPAPLAGSLQTRKKLWRPCLVPEDVTRCCYGASLVLPQNGN